MAVLTSNYPASLDTTATLGEVSNRAKSTLSTALASTGETTISLADASLFPATGTVTIDNEIFTYSAKSGNNLTIENRSRQGTTGAAHLVGAIVYLRFTKGHWEVLRTSVLNLEAKLGTGTSVASAGATNNIFGLTAAGVSAWGTPASFGITFDALSPVTTLGDMIYGSGTNTSTRLAGNASNIKKFLTQTGTGTVSAAPAWNTIAMADLGGSPSAGTWLQGDGSWTNPLTIGNGISAGAANGVLYQSGTFLAQSATFIYNGSLGVGVTPVAKIHSLSTTEQLRLSYNAGNYFSTVVDSSGNATFSVTGTTPIFSFSQTARFTAAKNYFGTDTEGVFVIPYVFISYTGQTATAVNTTSFLYVIGGVSSASSNSIVIGANINLALTASTLSEADGIRAGVTVTSGTPQYVYGGNFTVSIPSGSTVGTEGYGFNAQIGGLGTCPAVYGNYAYIYAGNGSNFTTVSGMKVLINCFGSTGTMGTVRGVAFEGWNRVGTITNSYAIYADTSIDVGQTLKYFIYSTATSPSYMVGKIGIGTGVTAPTARLHIRDTTEPFRLDYDASNYFNVIVSSAGIATLGATGTKFIFNKPVEVPDDAYNATSWSGSVAVPTKNAVRNKIESMAGATFSNGKEFALRNNYGNVLPMTI